MEIHQALRKSSGSLVKCRHCHNLYDHGHESVCGHRHVLCPRCGTDVEAYVLVTTHVKTCVKRPIQCADCKGYLPADQLIHHEPRCAYKSLRCKYCKRVMIAKEFEGHILNLCEERKAAGIVIPENTETVNASPTRRKGSRAVPLYLESHYSMENPLENVSATATLEDGRAKKSTKSSTPQLGNVTTAQSADNEVTIEFGALRQVMEIPEEQVLEATTQMTTSSNPPNIYSPAQQSLSNETTIAGIHTTIAPESNNIELTPLRSNRTHMMSTPSPSSSSPVVDIVVDDSCKTKKRNGAAIVSTPHLSYAVNEPETAPVTQQHPPPPPHYSPATSPHHDNKEKFSPAASPTSQGGFNSSPSRGNLRYSPSELNNNDNDENDLDDDMFLKAKRRFPQKPMNPTEFISFLKQENEKTMEDQSWLQEQIEV